METRARRERGRQSRKRERRTRTSRHHDRRPNIRKSLLSSAHRRTNLESSLIKSPIIPQPNLRPQNPIAKPSPTSSQRTTNPHAHPPAYSPSEPSSNPQLLHVVISLDLPSPLRPQKSSLPISPALSSLPPYRLHSPPPSTSHS